MFTPWPRATSVHIGPGLASTSTLPWCGAGRSEVVARRRHGARRRRRLTCEDAVPAPALEHPRVGLFSKFALALP